MRRFARYTVTVIAAFFGLASIAVGGFRLLPRDFRGHRFLNAARVGDIGRARLLLLLGSDIDYMSGSGSALHIAAARGDTAFMEFLLKRGAAPDLAAKFGVTPLYYARISSHPAAEQILINYGANTDISHIQPP